MGRAPTSAPATANHLPTSFLLMAQYGGRAIVPIDEVCRDYFAHLTPEKLLRKVAAGGIKLPVVRMEMSQKSAKGVHLTDLADYLDKCRDIARREIFAISGE